MTQSLEGNGIGRIDSKLADDVRKQLAEESLNARTFIVAPTEGYYQTIQRVVPELKDEEASTDAHATKRAMHNRDELKIGEELDVRDKGLMVRAIGRSLTQADVDRMLAQRTAAKAEAEPLTHPAAVAAEKAQPVPSPQVQQVPDAVRKDAQEAAPAPVVAAPIDKPTPALPPEAKVLPTQGAQDTNLVPAKPADATVPQQSLASAVLDDIKNPVRLWNDVSHLNANGREYAVAAGEVVAALVAGRLLKTGYSWWKKGGSAAAAVALTIGATPSTLREIESKKPLE